MLLITKELTEAVVKSHTYVGAFGLDYCSHCEVMREYAAEEIEHTPECIVTRAKLLLEQEWGIKS